MDLRHQPGSAAASMIAWLDNAQAHSLLDCVQRSDTRSARVVLASAGIEVAPSFDLKDESWRRPFITELQAKLRTTPEVDDDAPTSNLPNYAQFATDVRELDAVARFRNRIMQEEDIDIGAEFGWED